MSSNVRYALKKLLPLVPDRKMLKIESVVASRTKSISILLENVMDVTNEFAIMRSMEILGCYQLHKIKTAPITIPKNHRYPVRTDSGARHWIMCKEWVSTEECMSHFKEQGHVVAMATPDAKLSIKDLDFSRQMVIVLGNENSGISEDLLAYKDLEFSLPMCGFTGSFNVSVAAAITLYHSYIQRTSNGVSLLKALMHPTNILFS